jgi:predicted phage terminase large subunit-like protein
VSKSEIKRILEREQRSIQAERTKFSPPTSTYDVIARCSPTLEKPVHLDPYVQVLDAAITGGDVKCVFAAPPQHGKTLSAAHALIFAAMYDAQHRPKDPRWHAYSTFSFDRARQIRNDVMRLAFEAGLDPHGTQDLLELAGGTKIKFGGTSAGSLTGFKVNGLHVIDDPIKDRKEANSPVIRDDRWNWFVEVAGTRMHPGSSVLLMMTRWHMDDLSGRVVKNEKWPYLRIPAICDDADDACGREIGAALWPSQRPLEWLKEKSEYRSPMTWAAMYQGLPRPMGDALFDVSHVHYYDALPTTAGYRIGYGADLAYTEKTRADWSVLLQGRMYGQDLYLTKILKKQCQADKFTALMRAWVDVPSERGDILWFGSTTEKGIAQLIRSQGGIPSFHFKQATEDKYVRATPTAEHLWNQDRVFLPRNAPWVPEFEDEVCGFSGMGDAVDDQVDAFAALGSLFLRGYGGKMGVGALNSALRGKLARGDRRLRLVG